MINYFRTSWRSLLHNKGMSTLNIAGLAIGMAASVLIFLWVDNELSFDKYHPGSERTYLMITRLPSRNAEWEGAAMLLGDAVGRNLPGIEAVTRLRADNLPVLEVRGELQYARNCAYVDPNWFRFFSYHFTSGDASALTGDPYAIVLTASAAKRYFGDKPALGETIRVDSLICTVRAVVTDAPANSSFPYEAYLPMAALLQNPEWRQNGEDWGNTDYRTFARLAPGFGVRTAETAMTGILRRISHDDAHQQSIGLMGLDAIHFDNSHSDTMFRHGNRQATLLFSLLALVILIVACINYVNLTTAKASLRSREVSIHKIMGAARFQLFLQFAAESLLVSMLALGCTLFLVRLALPAFGELTGKDFGRAFGETAIWKVLGATLMAAFVLNSTYPALLLSSFKPLNIFRGITLLRLKDGYLRKGLVVLQFCVSIFLLTGTMVIYRQMQFVQQTNPGYDREQVMLLRLPMHVRPDGQTGDAATRVAALKQDLLGQTGIEKVSLVSQPVVQIGSVSTYQDWAGRDTTVTTKVAQLSADADLLSTLHLEMAEGRWFRNGDKSDAVNYILNETAVRHLQIRPPVIGAYFQMHGGPGRIVGVVKDFHFKSLHEKVGPLVIFDDPGWGHLFLVRVAPRATSTAVSAVRALWKKRFPALPLEYSFLDEQFDNLYQADAMASSLVFVFALVAVVISAMGLFGLAAFAAERRTKEIGIRKILGATTASIGGLLSGEFILLVAIAIGVAAPMAWFATRDWLANFAYHVGWSWWMFAMPCGFVLLMALSITGWQAMKVARKNPVRSLRPE